MASIASISGLASGIQWQDMVEQIMQLETARSLTPLTSQITAAQARSTAWSGYQSVLAKLADAAKALQSGSAFSASKVTAGTGAGGRALVAATAGEQAAPGRYAVEVLSLAQAEKLSGSAVPSATSALGLAGEFSINGRRVELAATDSLAVVRDKINAANTGASPSRVSASILSAGGAQRLVLTSETAGARGVDLVDGAGGVLRGLGLVGAEATANATATGGTQTRQISPVTQTIAAALGVTPPPASMVRVGDRLIAVDLAVDSLASIAARIRAEGIPAEVVTETVDGRTTGRLVVEGTVTAAPLTGAETPEEGAAKAAGARTLEVLGFTQPSRAAVAQVVAGELALGDAGGALSGASRLADLTADGDAAGVLAGDTITVRGTRGDGSPVLQQFTVAADDTVDTLLARVNDAFAGTRGATATLGADGRIRLTDAAGGESQLALSISVGRDGAEMASLGRMSTETVGRQRVVVAGSDARARIDGVLVTSASNTVTGAVAGLTLNLQAAEPGTVVDVTVARDHDAAVQAVQGFATAFNAVAAFVQQQSAAGMPLAGNGTLRSTLQQLKQALLTDQVGLPAGSAFARGALVGVALTRTGTLEVDAAKLKAALASNPADVRALFASAGSGDTSALSLFAAGKETKPGSYAVRIDTPATAATATGAGFGGAYAVAGPADRLRITDVGGKAAAVELRDGDTLADVVERLNAELRLQGIRAEASDVGGQLRVVALDVGLAAGFTAEFRPGTEGNANQLGVAGTVRGTDVAGTIGGRAATGIGWTLTSSEGDAQGLAVTYAGAATGDVGTFTYALGLGGTMTRLTDLLTRAGDGTIATQTTSIEQSVTALQRRADDVQARLDRRREALVAHFTAMEAALGRIQAQGNWLTQQLSALQGSKD